MELVSLQVDFDSIFEMRKADPENVPLELAKDTVPETLFKAPTEIKLELRVRGKRHHSCNTLKIQDTL